MKGGIITTTYTVRCHRDKGHIASVELSDRLSAGKRFRAMGWKELKVVGWTCAVCAKELAKAARAERWKNYKANETPEQREKRMAIQKRANLVRRDRLNAQMRKYASRPDVRAHKIEYMRKYNSTPERKAVQKIHNNRPEMKEHLARYKASGKTREWDRAAKKRKYEQKAIVQLANLAAELEAKK